MNTKTIAGQGFMARDCFCEHMEKLRRCHQGVLYIIGVRRKGPDASGFGKPLVISSRVVV